MKDGPGANSRVDSDPLSWPNLWRGLVAFVVFLLFVFEHPHAALRIIGLEMLFEAFKRFLDPRFPVSFNGKEVACVKGWSARLIALIFGILGCTLIFNPEFAELMFQSRAYHF